MAVNGLTSTATNRITGLATGLDTDQLVKDLMSIEKIKLNRIQQKKELTTWKTDAYRSITNLLRSMKDNFLDVLKPSSNMLSQSSYKKYTATTTDSSVVTASGSSEALSGVHKITVNELASAAVMKSDSSISKSLEGALPADFDGARGKSFNINLDGVTKSITISDAINSAADLQAAVAGQFGAGKISITDKGDGTLVFTSTGGASKIMLTEGSSDALSALGFTGTAVLTNRISINETLSSLSMKLKSSFTLDSDKVKLTINEKAFEFSGSTTLRSMMNTVNSDTTAGVILQYDEITDKIKITAAKTGAGNTISISESGSTFLAAVGLDAPDFTPGADAQAVLDGETITRSTNSFIISGVTYNLMKKSAAEQTVSLSLDVDSVFSGIKSFIEKYNETISSINTKLTEEYDRDYLPLTDEQKESMSEEEIKKWEDRAKTGILRNDSILQNIVYKMRRALSDSVSGISSNLSAIGITTGTYQDKGKLKIDESKLKASIQSDPELIMNLFSKASSITDYTNATSEQKTQRYNEEGLAYRLSDIINDNIRTIRDSNGKKGTLLEKAGIEGDITEFTSLMYTEISAYEISIDKMLDKMADIEENYYKKFAALEKAIAQMNTQSNWLTSQFSGGNQ